MGTLYVVATPIGNLGDTTKRALEILNEVDFIAVEDTRQTIKLLNHYGIKTKMISYHKFNEVSRTEEIINKLENNLNGALVSDAGTPCISDPGYILISELKKRGINVMGIPGPSAMINALAISGLPTTNFAFYGFLSTSLSKQKKELRKIAENNINTFVLYESPKRLVKLVENIKDIFPECTISILSDMTKKFERNFYGNVGCVYETIKQDPKIEKGEYVVVINSEQKIIKKDDVISIESKIVDIMLKYKCSIKDAINKLSSDDEELKKNDIYNASLNLKNLLLSQNSGEKK